MYISLLVCLCADLPTCLPSSKRKYNIYIEALYIKDERWVSGSAIALSICRPADLPTCRPTSHPEYNICIEINLYLLTVLSIWHPVDPSLILNLHTGLIIGHAGLISSRVIVKARYGVCILFWGVWGAAPQASYYDRPIT